MEAARVQPGADDAVAVMMQGQKRGRTTPPAAGRVEGIGKTPAIDIVGIGHGNRFDTEVGQHPGQQRARPRIRSFGTAMRAQNLPPFSFQ